jgi:hypothetical protein
MERHQSGSNEATKAAELEEPHLEAAVQAALGAKPEGCERDSGHNQRRGERGPFCRIGCVNSRSSSVIGFA